MTSKFTIGADPELFLVNEHGKFISAVHKIGGSKKRPRPIGQDCSVQEDNVAVEFCIPPCSDADKFVESINYSLAYITNQMLEQGLFINLVASKSFDSDQLQHLRAREFGCDPDYNAWTGMKNDRPSATDKNLRSAGGHVHIGSSLNKMQLIRWCDVMMGLPSIVEDSDTDRRQLYGKAGAFRGKDYGVEYRTLSNYWLGSEMLMRRVYHRVSEAVRVTDAGFTLDDKDGIDIQQAINQSDVKHARKLMDGYADLYGVAY
jgi:hypothetical protein